MKKTILILNIALFAALACSSKPEQETTTLEEVQPIKTTAEVVVGALQVKPLVETITTTGQIDVPPMERKVIHSYIAANINYLGVIQGEKVRKGQVLARLSHPNLILLQQQLLESKIDIDFQTKELARKKQLLQSNATSQKDINELEKALSLANSKYQSAASQLKLLGLSAESIEKNGTKEFIEIVAPFDSQVSKVMVTNGQFIASDQPILELINVHHKHLELNIFAKDAHKVKIGQKIEFNLPGSDEVFEGEVYLINPDIADNKLRVHGHLKDESLELKIGTFIEARIVINDNEVAQIENEELIRENNEYFLFQKNGSDYERVMVQLGRRNEQYSEILNAGEINNWVLKGNYYLHGF